MAFVEALTYAVDPLYLGLSCMFMTDIPFTALLILSVCRSRWAQFWPRPRDLAGSGLGLRGPVHPQTGSRRFFGFLVASPLKYWLGRRWLLRAVLPVLVAGFSLSAFIRMLPVAGRLPGMFYLKANTLKDMIRELLHLHPLALKPAMQAALIMMLFAGLGVPIATEKKTTIFMGTRVQ